MTRRISNIQELGNQRDIEQSIFWLEEFTKEKALFPEQVFRVIFETYVFLPFKDWFINESDYSAFTSFLKNVGEEVFFIACPYCNLPTLEISSLASLEVYINALLFRFKDLEDTADYNSGMTRSPEVFFYGRNQNWAMVHDISHNLIVIGLKRSQYSAFTSAFGDQCMSAQSSVKYLEDLHGGAEMSSQDVQRVMHNYG
jgi:hypothetical protein